MKRILAAAIVVAAAGLIGGCMPMSQAALVYSSKVQVGVNVAAATPENPGLELNIGVNAVDAAYVPVAVARACESGVPVDCESSSYDLRDVRGANNESDAQTSDRAVDNARRAARELNRDIERLNGELVTARGVVAAKTAELQQLNNTSSTIGETGATGAMGAVPAQDEAATADALARAAALRGEIKTGEEAVAALEIQLRRRNEELAAALLNQERLEELADRMSSDVKEDALSVFGSFNGDADAGANNPSGGGTASAGLQFGKVFSTGVASQNLTQGIRNAARATALSDCFASAANAGEHIPDPARREQIVRELVARCAATAGAE